MTDQEYEVECILGKCTINSEDHYKVKWKGFDECTWEPATQLTAAAHLINEFYQKLDQQATNAQGK